jgi:hypothetical protein
MTSEDEQRRSSFERARQIMTSLPGWLSVQANAIEGMNALPSRFEQLITQGRNAEEANCEARLEGFEIQAKSYLDLVSDRDTLAAYCIFLKAIRDGELAKVQRVVHRTPKPIGINEEFWEYKNANYPDDSERVYDPLGGEIVRFESGLIEKIQEWTGKAHRRAAQIEGSPGPLATRVPQPTRETTLLEMANRFRGAGKDYQSTVIRLRAEFISIPGRESWGIWKLRPNTKESEPARERFELMATLAVQEFHIAPISPPQAHEFDPNWSEEARPFLAPDGSEPIPSG